MEEAINRTLSSCYDLSGARSYISKLFSPALSDPLQLATIACEAARLSKLSPTLYATFYFKFRIIGGFVGILSAILALLSYSLKEFSSPTFIYFRVISFLDFIYMLYCVVSGFRVSTLVPQSPGWLYANEAWLYVVRFCAKSAHLLVIWLAFDRCVACTRAVVNNKFNKRPFIIKVIVAIFAFSLIYDIAPTYFGIRTRYFNETSPETGLAIASRILTGIEGVLILVFTITVIVGLVRTSERKRKLMGKKKTNENSTTSAVEKKSSLIAQIKTNQSLCILQLCEDVPYLFADVAIYLSYATNFLMIDRDAALPYIAGGSFEANLKHQWMFAFQTYVKLVVINITDIYAHGFHFYNYLAFSPKFRRAVVGYLRRKGNAVSP